MDWIQENIESYCLKCMCIVEHCNLLCWGYACLCFRRVNCTAHMTMRRCKQRWMLEDPRPSMASNVEESAVMEVAVCRPLPMVSTERTLAAMESAMKQFRMFTMEPTANEVATNVRRMADELWAATCQCEEGGSKWYLSFNLECCSTHPWSQYGRSRRKCQRKGLELIIGGGKNGSWRCNNTTICAWCPGEVGITSKFEGTLKCIIYSSISSKMLFAKIFSMLNVK